MKCWRNNKYFFLLVLLLAGMLLHSQRKDMLLNDNWYTIASADSKVLPTGFFQVGRGSEWKKVNIPHNWDQYEGYRRLLHGNRHGDAWYEKFLYLNESKKGKRYFLYFEGVGSYANVYVNDRLVGEHAGGRTGFTIDITDVIRSDDANNRILVRAWHPSDSNDLPWVCGGCSEERGFSEGSQPFGIFRPVHLVVTNDVRVSPFGVHAWAAIKKDGVTLNINTSVKNYSARQRKLVIVQQLLDQGGRLVDRFRVDRLIRMGDSVTAEQSFTLKKIPVRWSVERPYLYTIETILMENNKVIDRVQTPFGFRTINWKTPGNQFLLNDKPVFINGIAEYEHLLGQSHAFSNEQIISRINWVQSAGFNAFRDGHHPHNLLYGNLCEQRGLLWWTQLSAHVWYDTPAFRKNFKNLLREWVIERRNNPAVILWGLQNESKLPEDFAKECTELIRSLDPTASSQRLVTTCNGGTGTDWDVPQNWTGTYGGNPDDYAKDLKKQVLVGEYGAWRSIDLHTEGDFVQNGPLSEDRFTRLMEQKIRLAESVKDSVAGHFFWLLTSHDNPGRVQGGEGLREIDRIGPVNYKGLLTPWEEPTDAYYMFRSNYVPATKDPMVYIVSHTWPNRWLQPGIKSGIVVYSNCEEVELFNDMGSSSLGRRKRNGTGTHFQWDSVTIKYNVLYAVGYVRGKAVTKDTMVLMHLPVSPGFSQLYTKGIAVNKPNDNADYLYRVNCGGPDYIDEFGNTWKADEFGFDSRASNAYKSYSWTRDFPGLPERFASQRRIFTPLKNTRDWKLFQSFRYGLNKLKFELPLEEGDYIVELYFVEPWAGKSGGSRLFDVAINGKIVLKNLDIRKEAGTNAVLKKTISVHNSQESLLIDFPAAASGEAVISAIAIARPGREVREGSGDNRDGRMQDYIQNSWMDIGDRQYREDSILINSLPPALYGADWFTYKDKLQKRNIWLSIRKETDVYVGVPPGKNLPDTLKGFENTQTNIVTDENGGTIYTVYRKRYPSGNSQRLPFDASYIVALRPADHLQPAYDLKPVTPYRSNVAQISGGITKDSLNGRLCCVFNSDNVSAIEWPVQTGVGDIYSITLKYYYPDNQPVKGRLQLYDAGGNRMMDEEVQFIFTREGKWNQFTVNTGTQINAGNYKVKLIVETAGRLAVSGIEIQ